VNIYSLLYDDLSESGYPGFEDLQDFCLNQDVQDFRIYRIFSGTMEIKKL